MTAMTVTASAPSKCEANATGRTVTDWGVESLPCQVRTGLRYFTDRQGIRRAFCPSLGHQENAKRRFGLQMYEGMGDDDWDDRKSRIDAAVLADPERPS